MKPLEELLEIAKSATQGEWKAGHFFQQRVDRGSMECICSNDYDNCYHNLSEEEKARENFKEGFEKARTDVPVLSDAVIDLITQLKDAQVEIDWRKDNYYKLDDVNCKLNERIVKLEQRLKESYDKGFGDGWENGIVPWKSRVQKLEQRLAECETVVKFYAHDRTWSPDKFLCGSEVLRSDLSETIWSSFTPGMRAREYLSKWGVK